VLHEVEEHILTPQAVENFLLAVDQQTSQDGERRARLEKELADVKRREAALVAAVEGGGSDLGPIIERMKALEGRRNEIEHELKAATPVPRLEPRVLESRLAEWRRILRGRPRARPSEGGAEPAAGTEATDPCSLCPGDDLRGWL
jgi:hypothetical protein